ncbi:hypothetical protein [Dyadobacter sp. CY347]|uniref:hypothetical protein n=1 Tax=Dyadobacter sp. CY347 TaxID=2909336 RepID=UPI001F33035C|nr:hypothetical protein [Dyadobacter sp. CY347]MCF2489439.1 hypothetical protein [Dyadobacter sp. CY347]
MKTSENKLNEALRSALKRKFDNFENAPDPSAFEKIRANIKPAPQWRYLFFSLLFVGLAITGIITDQHFMDNKAGKTGVVYSADVKKTVAESPVEVVVMDKPLVVERALAEPVSEKPALTVPVSKATFTPNPHNANQNSLAASIEENVTSADIEESESGQPAADKSGDEAMAIAAHTLANQQYKFETNHSGLPKIDIPKADIKPVVPKQIGQFNWLVNAAVLQSYQILTVPAGGQSFQNFEFPSTFSLRSLGFKVSMGAEKKGFQFMLHYSRFRQSYSYEIAGSDYIVHTVDQDKFVVIRQGTRVSQDNQFSLLGIGVNKQVQWGNASVGKYYASAGLEYSYGMIRKQSIGWVNAGIGKQFPISRNTSLHIGPYAEFSPVKFTGSGDPFFYQPYRVGISAGLRFGK